MKIYDITITEDEILRHMELFSVSRERAIEELNIKEIQEQEMQEVYEDVIRSSR